MTTFLDAETNRDIADGDWRALNLQRAPLDFPDPVALINEGCREANNDYADKSLGLRRIDDLPDGR